MWAHVFKRKKSKHVMFNYFSFFPVFLFVTACSGDWQLLVVCPRQHGTGQSLDDWFWQNDSSPWGRRADTPGGVGGGQQRGRLPLWTGQFGGHPFIHGELGVLRFQNLLQKLLFFFFFERSSTISWECVVESIRDAAFVQGTSVSGWDQ